MKSMTKLELIVLGTAFLAVVVTAYPSGAPDSACASLQPVSHGPTTATGPNPFSIAFSPNTYSPGQVFTVTLSGAPFKGLLIQGRRADGSTVAPVGFFQNPTSDSKLACTGISSGNGVTQTANSVKTSATFQWKAPSSSVGDIVFLYTVIRGKAPNTSSEPSDYYANITSSTLRPSTGDDTLLFRPESLEPIVYMDIKKERENIVDTDLDRILRRAFP